MTTASKVTMVRIALIPVFFILMYWAFPGHSIIALIIFALASITDSVDGYIARKYNQISTFGKFVDPLADKLLIVSAILLFVERGQMQAWAAMIIVAREFAVTGLRLVAVEGGIVIAAGLSGKVKTVISVIVICVMLTDLQKIVLIPGVITLNGLCVWLMVLSTLYSGGEYFIRNYKLLNVKK
ncbi:MAG: CDP-diacylglycerol--glycerol-3-phosphate 3-phosphatidyltransferase [Firmicutes bacterium]|nr:CDP-diacylglycerol--glycerol-3-phosphate 3-phosphatidyltransferase [Bacillota bacterium]